MEAVMMNSTGDNNHNHRFGTPNRNFAPNRTLFPYPSDNLLLSTFLSGGYFSGSGLLSYPPAVSVFQPPRNIHHYRQQPPLLPLPVSMPLNRQNTNNNIRLSPPRINKNAKNRARDCSLTPKKSKNQKKDSKKEVVDLDLVVVTATAEEKQPPPPENCSVDSSIEPDLPKEVMISRVSSSLINKSGDIESVDDDEFSGSVVFTPSPPPSSLPLPTFFLRPKVSCKVEAAAVASGVDVGATDGLRRLLRL